MTAEQQLQLAVINSVGDTIRHIIAPPPMAFQNMIISEIIGVVRSTYNQKSQGTLTKKLDNVRNWRTHSAKMRNAFTISTTAGIIIDEYRRVEAVRKSIIGHHQMVTILKDYDNDYPDLHTRTFSHLTAYLELRLPNVASHDDATKAHGLSTQINDKPGDDILLNMNAAQVTAYLALQDEVKKLRKIVQIGIKNQNDQIGNLRPTRPLRTNQSDLKRNLSHVQTYIAGVAEHRKPTHHPNAS
jgi:hypothetical protein